ncbi:MAG TPA: MarR family transcriptional regulator [Candidatus Acidoferrales bacterium]|nr:MarR family transcriptional regulator [Candidatus Acidoferrales bacterium]
MTKASFGTSTRKTGRRTVAEKTRKAFQAYLELLDTGSWVRFQVEEQLGQFDLNVEEFRFLELLHREGPMTTSAIAERRWCRRQSVLSVAARLEDSGWVLRQPTRLPAADIDEKRLQKSLRGRLRVGRKAVQLSLTKEGENLIASVIPRQAKLVYALMLAVSVYQVDALVETCRKLREGNVVKLLNEITMRDQEEVEEAEEA